jgi:hypothetical protein
MGPKLQSGCGRQSCYRYEKCNSIYKIHSVINTQGYDKHQYS